MHLDRTQIDVVDIEAVPQARCSRTRSARSTTMVLLPPDVKARASKPCEIAAVVVAVFRRSVSVPSGYRYEPPAVRWSVAPVPVIPVAEIPRVGGDPTRSFEPGPDGPPRVRSCRHPPPVRD